MARQRAADLGKVTCSLRGSVVAGSWQTCSLTYTAGFAGIDDTGSLKIVMRYATDAGTPQFDNPAGPNHTTAVASNGAHLQLRYDVKDNRRPWGKTIQIKVLQGYLRRGDQITLTIGDTTAGSPGWRMQTFYEDSFELKVLVDRYATYVYEELARSPTFRIVAGEPVRLVAVAPSLVSVGRKIPVRYRLEDGWGNPLGKARRIDQPAYSTPGVFRIQVTDDASGLSGETNPIVVRSQATGGRFWADIHGQSEETIGTNTIDRYFRFARDYALLDVCGHQGNDFQITDSFWEQINQASARFNRPQKFVVFPGWEWSGNTGLGGDRNVFFREEGGLISRSSRALVEAETAVDPGSETVEQLFERLNTSDVPVMLIPHVGGRYADLARHSEPLEPVVEVHSAWGTFEWMLDDAFKHGYRVGIVANSDGHKGRPGASYPGASTFGSYGGLTCILADRLDREPIWQSYQQRRVYATTGARIFLEWSTTDGAQMGDCIQVTGSQLPALRCFVAGTAPIERVEIRNGMRVEKTVRTYTTAELSNRIKILWQGATVRGRGRQVVWDGELAVRQNRIRTFQTINFWNLEKRCERLGPARLGWQSVTTGGVSGLILDLEHRNRGTMHVKTTQKSFQTEFSRLGINQRGYNLGGIGKCIATYRLPAANGPRELEFTWQPTRRNLHAGDNPIYVCAVQEDGHMAWSSPIYLVGEARS